MIFDQNLPYLRAFSVSHCNVRFFCKSVSCGDFKFVGVCGWAERLGGTFASLAVSGQKKKKKLKLCPASLHFSPIGLLIICCLFIFSLSLSHIHTYIRTDCRKGASVSYIHTYIHSNTDLNTCTGIHANTVCHTSMHSNTHCHTSIMNTNSQIQF